MSEINVKIDAFEGPLDLLLHLIQHLEIDIYDIPIAEVTSQYLTYIQTMKVLELDIAGDYLVMAATLMAIKSKLLLPKQELVLDTELELIEEGEDPRDALVEQLLEYQKYKKAAAVLKTKEEERSQYYTKEPQNLDQLQKNVPLEPLQISTLDLVVAFQKLLTKRLKKAPLQTKVMAEEVTISEKMAFILASVSSASSKTGIRFTDLFTEPTKKDMVTTFMALLELIKEQTISFQQAEKYGEILIYAA
ncbi:segregation/condensation protein A, partial [Carnobacterium sp.]|uniref:segregation/condensation protein A n=1 Tax=Carnobacterium sp. TaxID=48221 RepID=UPI0028A9B88B